MLIVSNVYSAMMGSITLMYIMDQLLGRNYKTNKINSTILLTLLTGVTYLSASMVYNTESILFKITMYIMIYIFLGKKSPYKTIISLFLTIIILSDGDLIVNLIFLNNITVEQAKGIWYWVLVCNTLVYVFTIGIFSIPILKKRLCKFIQNLNDTGKISTIFIMILSVTIIINIFYNISVNYNLSEKYILNVIISITYFVIILIFLKDRLEYQKLVNQYDCLFDYFKEFEDSMDNISLANHEYKNQLAILKEYIEHNKRKEALNFINSMSLDISEDDKYIVAELKSIPKGGIKGLLYYKIITARNKSVLIMLDINKSVTSTFKSLSSEENKILSEIIGVYIDNAIEAASNTKNKVVTIEIYPMNENINIVISNSFKEKTIKIDKIGKKGYSTKGIGHGRGLYLISKLINKTNFIETDKRIINNYYIQKIIIKKKSQ